jgi:predicted DNA-binding transcriptional regulator YafY
MVIKVPFLSEDWLIRWVLGLGGSVQVIEPQEIAERLVSTIREGLDRLQAHG